MIRELNYNEVFDAQRHFRIILDSMARPGNVNKLDGVEINAPDDLNKASAFIAFALLNSDVSFFTNKNQKELSEFFVVNTNSRLADSIDKANFVFINGTDKGEVISETNAGLLEYPETSATVVIDVDTIYDVPKNDTHEIILAGPGVETEKRVYVKNINTEILKAIKEQNSEYPLGIDIILTDKTGNILCIPRSNKFSWN